MSRARLLAVSEAPRSAGKLPRSQWREVAAWWLLLCAALGLYVPLTGIPPFGDDYLYLFENPRRAIYDYFVSYHDFGGVFRPMQIAWSAVNQFFFAEGTFALQTGQAVMHGLLACVLFHFLRMAGLAGLPCFLGAILFVVSPAATSAVLGNDTCGQIGATGWGFVSFALAWGGVRRLCGRSSAAVPARPPIAARAVLSVVALGVALLFKETALAFVPILMLTLLYGAVQCRRAGRPPGARKLAVLFLAYVAIVGLYFIYRGQMASTRLIYGAEGNYAFRMGPNILKNEALLFGGALLPFSTVDAIVAATHRAAAVLAGIGAIFLVWLALVMRGLLLARTWPATLGLLVLAACATVPPALMNHVSELYTYTMLPFLTTILALALAALLEYRRPAAGRAIAAGILAIVLASDVVAVVRKATQMRHNGEATASLAAQAVDAARQLPPGGMMLLVDRPQAGAVFYSVFLTRDFQGLFVADRWIKHLAQRPDISIKVAYEDQVAPADLIFVRDDTGGQAKLRAWVPRTTTAETHAGNGG